MACRRSGVSLSKGNAFGAGAVVVASSLAVVDSGELEGASGLLASFPEDGGFAGCSGWFVFSELFSLDASLWFSLLLADAFSSLPEAGFSLSSAISNSLCSICTENWKLLCLVDCSTTNTFHILCPFRYF